MFLFILLPLFPVHSVHQTETVLYSWQADACDTTFSCSSVVCRAAIAVSGWKRAVQTSASLHGECHRQAGGSLPPWRPALHAHAFTHHGSIWHAMEDPLSSHWPRSSCYCLYLVAPVPDREYVIHYPSSSYTLVVSLSHGQASCSHWLCHTYWGILPFLQLNERNKLHRPKSICLSRLNLQPVLLYLIHQESNKSR